MVLLALMLLPTIGLADTRGPTWLRVRRHGTAGIIASALEVSTPQTWGATFRSVPAPATARPQGTGQHASVARRFSTKKPITIRVAHRRQAAPKGRKSGKTAPVYESIVVIDGLPAGRAGIAVSGEQAWVRLPGKKVQKATGVLLNAKLPALDAPLILFALVELTSLFDVKLEGEFGGTGVMRMHPKYTAGSGFSLCKLGVSKQTLYPELAAVGGGDGQGDIKLNWHTLRPTRGVTLPAKMRIMYVGSRTHVDFDRIGLTLGPSAERLKFGPGALK